MIKYLLKFKWLNLIYKLHIKYDHIHSVHFEE